MSRNGVAGPAEREEEDGDDDDAGRYRQRRSVMVNRESLKLHRGEWVCVVGWLEGPVSRSRTKVCEL